MDISAHNRGSNTLYMLDTAKHSEYACTVLYPVFHLQAGNKTIYYFIKCRRPDEGEYVLSQKPIRPPK